MQIKVSHPVREAQLDQLLKGRFFVKWFRTRGRHFPWRNQKINPFKVLITEMLVRQTRAYAVAAIWKDFTRKYPDPSAIISTSEEQLYSDVKVLGFGRQRTSALKSAASYLIEFHDGKVPTRLDELLKVPHIGHYSSRAILCFAFNHRVEIVDVNVLRFFSRFLGLRVNPDIRRNPRVWKFANLLLPRTGLNAKEHNYGLLDFTGEVCTAMLPSCWTCPLRTQCRWPKKVRNIKRNRTS